MSGLRGHGGTALAGPPAGSSRAVRAVAARTTLPAARLP